MTLNIQDIISMSIGLLYIIPLFLYYITGNRLHFTGFLGLASTTIITEGIKYFLIKERSPRPKGAKNCDLLCQDGNQEGRPGMPSTHSANVAYFAGFYIQQTDNIFIKIGLVLYAALVMLSRYLKRCHTINQIAVGSLLGLVLSFFSSSLVRQL